MRINKDNPVVNDVDELEKQLKEWLLDDDIPEDQTVEIPLFVIRDFRDKCYHEQDIRTLEGLRNKITDIIERSANGTI